MVAVQAKVELTGPFFQRDPAQTFSENVQRMMEGLAQEGEQSVVRILSAGAGGRATIARIPSDRVAEHVHGRVRSMAGRHWRMNAVISVNNSGLGAAEGISLMAAAAQLEGRLHAFRRTASALRRAISKFDLAKGLA